MKDNKYIKSFGEFNENLNISDVRSSKINENLSESSKDDLINLKSELEFVNEYEIEIYEVVEIIDKLLKMSWDEIEGWREHIDTNYTKGDKDKFTLRLIDRYCSNIEDDN
jgi:hypothetical protein